MRSTVYSFITWFWLVNIGVGFVAFCVHRKWPKKHLRERLDASLLKISLPPKGYSLWKPSRNVYPHAVWGLRTQGIVFVGEHSICSRPNFCQHQRYGLRQYLPQILTRYLPAGATRPFGNPCEAFIYTRFCVWERDSVDLHMEIPSTHKKHLTINEFYYIIN